MKKKILLFSLLLAVLCFALTFWFEEEVVSWIDPLEQVSQEDSWVQYVPKEGGFEISFPTKPEVKEHMVQLSDSSAPLCVPEYVAKKNATYSVSYVDIPRKWSFLSSNMLLKGALRTLISKKPGAKLIEKQTIKHQGYPALDFLLKEGDMQMQGRMVLVGKTLYKLSASYDPQEEGQEVQNMQFLNSFSPKK